MAKGIYYALIDAGMLNYPAFSDILAREDYTVYVVAPTYMRKLHSEIADQRGKLEDALRNQWSAEESLKTEETDNEALEMENGILKTAIRWALGEAGEFPTRRRGTGQFWWRDELRSRSLGCVLPGEDDDA